MCLLCQALGVPVHRLVKAADSVSVRFLCSIYIDYFFREAQLYNNLHIDGLQVTSDILILLLSET
jgi:hypothetical protein